MGHYVNPVTQPRQPQHVKATKRKEAIVIGSSLVRDVGVDLNNLGHEAISYTNPGCCITHIVHRIKYFVPRNYTGNVTLLRAGNDCEISGAEEVINMYEKLIESVKKQAPDCNLILTAIPPRPGSDFLKYKIGQVNCYLHYVAVHDENIDFLENVPDNSNLHFKHDNLHFNTFGRKLFSSRLSKLLTSRKTHAETPEGNFPWYPNRLPT